MSELKPCLLCGGGDTRVDESRMPPRMNGTSALIGVSINHWCQGFTKGAQRRTISVHGRDHADAYEAWNTRHGDTK